MHSHKSTMSRSSTTSHDARNLAQDQRRQSPHPVRQNCYATSEDASAFVDIDIDIRPPPSAITSSTATAYNAHDSPSPLQDYPDLTHPTSTTRPRSTFFETCSPLITRATSTISQHTSRASVGGAFHSPTKSLASFLPSRSALESTTSAVGQPKIRAIQNWFNGASSPVSLGVGRRQDDGSDSESDAEEQEQEYDSESGEEYDSEADEEDEREDVGGGRIMSSIFNRGTGGSGLTQRTATRQGQASHAASSSASSSSTSNPTPPTPSRFSWLRPSATPNLSSPSGTRPSSTASLPVDVDVNASLLALSPSTALFPHGAPDPLSPHSFNDLLSTATTLLTQFQSSYRSLHTALVDARAEQSATADELEESETRVRVLRAQMAGLAAREEGKDAEIAGLRAALRAEREGGRREDAERQRVRRLGSVEMVARRERRASSGASVDSGFESDCSSSSSSGASVVVAQGVYAGKHGVAEERQNRGAWTRSAGERDENAALRRRVAELEGAVEGALRMVGALGL